MNRYKFSEEEVPYGTLEQFGLTREMVGDLPVDVLQAIQSGRRSPVLPIRADDSEGNTIHARTRFSLVRREDGTADVLFYPVLVESRLERFSEEQKQRLLEGKAVIAPMQDNNDNPVQAFHQIDSGTKQILSVPHARHRAQPANHSRRVPPLPCGNQLPASGRTANRG